MTGLITIVKGYNKDMKTVAVIFGGRSTEHDVSIMTALASVIKPLELTGQYKVEAVYVDKKGVWHWGNRFKDIKLYQSAQLDDYLSKDADIQLLLKDGLTLTKPGKLSKHTEKIDIVFPAMHGTHGEDGELMGLLEMANVPYVGCDVPSSAVAMDKVLSKQVTASAGLPSTPWMWFYSRDLQSNQPKILAEIKKLDYPLFVKPAHLGSSIGITRVTEPDQLMSALEVAAHYDDKVIVEQGVANLIEVTLPVMGNEEPVPALLEQPLLHAEDFFDFETKYIGGGKKGGQKSGKRGAQGYSKLPAEIPKAMYDRAVKLGIDVYKTIGCSGISRVDMLIDSKAGTVLFNEINPLPGDLYRHNWHAAGVSSTELVTTLVNYAVARWETEQKQATAFSTNFLKQF